MTLKLFSDSEESIQELMKIPGTVPTPGDLPEVIVPAGLDAKRQWYLYDEIRDFVKEECKELVCPHPAVPKPGRHQENNYLGYDDIEPLANRGRRQGGVRGRGGGGGRGRGRRTGRGQVV